MRGLRPPNGFRSDWPVLTVSPSGRGHVPGARFTTTADIGLIRPCLAVRLSGRGHVVQISTMAAIIYTDRGTSGWDKDDVEGASPVMLVMLHRNAGHTLTMRFFAVFHQLHRNPNELPIRNNQVTTCDVNVVAKINASMGGNVDEAHSANTP